MFNRKQFATLCVMSTVPSSLVAPLRAALQAQGFPSQSITESGEIDPGMLLAGAFQKVTLRTRLAPPVRLDTAETFSTQTPAGFWTHALQPAIVFESNGSTYTFAPVGDPGAQQGWLWTATIVLGLVGLGYWLGKRKRL